MALKADFATSDKITLIMSEWCHRGYISLSLEYIKFFYKLAVRTLKDLPSKDGIIWEMWHCIMGSSVFGDWPRHLTKIQDVLACASTLTFFKNLFYIILFIFFNMAIASSPTLWMFNNKSPQYILNELLFLYLYWKRTFVSYIVQYQW